MKVFAQNCLIDGAFAPALLEVSGKVISAITMQPAGSQLRDAIDLADGYLIPGLIDLQINGAFGVDFSSCPPQDAQGVLAALPTQGTTSICPTVITSGLAQIANQVRTLSALEPQAGHARSLGVHLEGPVIAQSRRGAHASEHIVSADEFVRYGVPLEKIALLTLAPELPGADELISAAVAAGVVVSMGHSNATAAQAKQAKRAGVSMATHLFNGMRPIHQREPGLTVSTLLDQDLHFGLIIDGEHVDYELVRLAQRLAKERMIIVSYASAALCSKPGTEFELGGSKVLVDEEGNARRSDGTLASSGISQLQAIEKAVAQGFDRAELLDSATRIPAEFMSQPRLGRIAVGAYADLVHYRVADGPVVDFALVGGAPCPRL